MKVLGREVRRHCYNKPHKCPGWQGGGWKYPKDDQYVCDGGHLLAHYEDSWHRLWYRKLLFCSCDTCSTIVLPEIIQWLDYTWWRFWLGRRWNKITYWWFWETKRRGR